MNRIFYLMCALGMSLAGMGDALADDDTHAGRAIFESIQASGNLSRGALHSIAASGQVVFAVSAVPLAVSGGVFGAAGDISAAAARDSMRAATAPIGTPLEITDQAITVMPPNEALKGQKNSPKP